MEGSPARGGEPFSFSPAMKAIGLLRDIQSLVALLLGSCAVTALGLPIGRTRVWLALPLVIAGVALWASPLEIMVGDKLASFVGFVAPASMLAAALFFYRQACPFPDEERFKRS